MRSDLDEHARAIAQRIGQDFSQWLVIWGTPGQWSRAVFCQPAPGKKQ